MYHRYGRHGPHAWRRRREQRFANPISAVGHVAREAVIHLQLPFVNAERIIIIIMSTDDNGRESTQFVEASAQVIEANQVNQVATNNHDSFEELRWAANSASIEQAQWDLDNLEDPPSLEGLKACAKSRGIQYVRQHITSNVAGGKTFYQLLDIYIDAFTEGYRNHREHETGNGILTDDLTIALKRKAHEDKASDHAHQISLPETELIYRSVIRVHNQLMSDPQELGYLQDIGKYAKRYKSEYEAYDPTRAKEEHRPNGSNQFPDYPDS